MYYLYTSRPSLLFLLNEKGASSHPIHSTAKPISLVIKGGGGGGSSCLCCCLYCSEDKQTQNLVRFYPANVETSKTYQGNV